MAGYRLKSGLSKTAVYQCCKDHLSNDVIQFPKLRQCYFERYRNTYSLSFCISGSDDIYEAIFTSFAGRCHVRLFRTDFEQAKGWERLAFVYVPFDYLQGHGMLREVA